MLLKPHLAIQGRDNIARGIVAFDHRIKLGVFIAEESKDVLGLRGRHKKVVLVVVIIDAECLIRFHFLSGLGGGEGGFNFGHTAKAGVGHHFVTLIVESTPGR